MRFRLKRMRFSTIGAQSKLESWPMPSGYASSTSAVGHWLHRVQLLDCDWHTPNPKLKQMQATGWKGTDHTDKGGRLTFRVSPQHHKNEQALAASWQKSGLGRNTVEELGDV